MAILLFHGRTKNARDDSAANLWTANAAATTKFMNYIYNAGKEPVPLSMRLELVAVSLSRGAAV